MNICDAQEKVDMQIMSYGGYWRIGSMFLRLTEEVGELARAINIKYGDKKSKSISDGREVAMEMVDVFYTSIALANFYKIDLAEEFHRLNITGKSIDELQNELSIDNSDKLLVLSKLVAKIGHFSELIGDPNRDVTSSLTGIIVTIIALASFYEINLSKDFKIKVSADEDKMNKVYSTK